VKGVSMPTILFEREGPIGWLTLNNPEKRNALSLELMSGIQRHLDQVAMDQEVRVVVIKANGPAFCAGHDIQEMSEDNRDVRVMREIFSTCTRMMLGLHALPQPVIAQVHGVATAAGCQLVAACDLAIAEEGARFATPGVKIGLFCTTPMVPLVRLIGRRRALDMLLSGRFISADEALRFGLVNRVVKPEELAAATKSWAMEIAQFSRYTISLGKQAFYRQVDLDEESAYGYAKEVIAMNCADVDAEEGMKAFLEKRAPQWKD
jgi:enoyl-CoA hydratase/carnithine racemase